MDDGICTANIFIDLKKAFLAKLRKYFVENKKLACFTSNLTNRKQFCIVKEYVLKMEDIHCGPWPSNVSHLYHVYINDLSFSLKKGILICSYSYLNSSYGCIKKNTDESFDHPQFFIGSSQAEKLTRIWLLSVGA